MFEDVSFFKAPELLEKYVIASEVTVEVLDVFLSRVFGTERGSIDRSAVDLKPLLENLGCFSSSARNDAGGEDLSARADEPDKEVEGLRVKVENLERQLCAVQRQLQMQSEVTKLAESLDERFDEMARECERQVSEVSEHVTHLETEVGEKASSGDMRSLSEEVTRLKEDERSLDDRISEAESRMTNEIQGDIKALQKALLGKEFVCDSSKHLDGIIARMTEVYGGNVHDKGVVEVTASSVLDSARTLPKNAVDFKTFSCFVSEKEPNSWLCYDFKWWRVAPTSYTIIFSDVKSWVLEVSNDGSEESWKVVDRRENSIKGLYTTSHFPISAPPGESFRFVRLRQTEPNLWGDGDLRVASLELFGTLSSP